MQLLPNWFYGLTSPELWPNRPREMYYYQRNVIPFTPRATDGLQTVEQVFNKRVDSLVFGGVILVTSSVAGFTNGILAPTVGGSQTITSISCRLYNPAADQEYTSGFVPLENLFTPWQHPGDRPCYWPIPIPVQRGGSLFLDLLDLNAVPITNRNLRFTFLSALIYDNKDREAA